MLAQPAPPRAFIGAPSEFVELVDERALHREEQERSDAEQDVLVQPHLVRASRKVFVDPELVGNARQQQRVDDAEPVSERRRVQNKHGEAELFGVPCWTEGVPENRMQGL